MTRALGDGRVLYNVKNNDASSVFYSRVGYTCLPGGITLWGLFPAANPPRPDNHPNKRGHPTRRGKTVPSPDPGQHGHAAIAGHFANPDVRADGEITENLSPRGDLENAPIGVVGNMDSQRSIDGPDYSVIRLSSGQS
jgi:hypothetical protein